MTHLINNIYGLTVPENMAKYYWSIDGKRLIFDVPLKDEIILNLPEGNWQIIGLAHEVTEEAAAEIVSDDYGKLPDFEHEGMIYSIAKESLSSLLHSKGLNENVLLLKKID